MKSKDLCRLSAGDIVVSVKHNARFEVKAIDTDDEEMPVLVKFISGPSGVYGRNADNTFDVMSAQWIFSKVDDLYDGVTLDDLELVTSVTYTESRGPEIPPPPKVELPTGKQAYDKALEVNLIRVALKLKTAVEDGQSSILLTDNEVEFLRDMLILKGFTLENNKLSWGMK